MESDASSSRSNDDGENELLDAAEVICVTEAVLAWKSNRMTRSRLHGQHHVQMLTPITCDVMLHCTICLLAQGSCHDIRLMASIQNIILSCCLAYNFHH